MSISLVFLGERCKAGCPDCGAGCGIVVVGPGVLPPPVPPPLATQGPAGAAAAAGAACGAACGVGGIAGTLPELLGPAAAAGEAAAASSASFAAASSSQAGASSSSSACSFAALAPAICGAGSTAGTMPELLGAVGSSLTFSAGGGRLWKCGGGGAKGGGGANGGAQGDNKGGAQYCASGGAKGGGGANGGAQGDNKGGAQYCVGGAERSPLPAAADIIDAPLAAPFSSRLNVQEMVPNVFGALSWPEASPPSQLFPVLNVVSLHSALPST
jgi:hypothetical protein